MERRDRLPIVAKEDSGGQLKKFRKAHKKDAMATTKAQDAEEEMLGARFIGKGQKSFWLLELILQGISWEGQLLSNMHGENTMTQMEMILRLTELRSRRGVLFLIVVRLEVIGLSLVGLSQMMDKCAPPGF